MTIYMVLLMLSMMMHLNDNQRIHTVYCKMFFLCDIYVLDIKKVVVVVVVWWWWWWWWWWCCLIWELLLNDRWHGWLIDEEVRSSSHSKPLLYSTYSTNCNELIFIMLLPSSSSSIDKDQHHHIGSGGFGSGPGSSGSSTAMLSGQSALMEIEKLLLKFDGIVIW